MDMLRQEVRGTGIKVSTKFPGRVDTGLVSNMSVLWISAKIPVERVARAIYKAVLKNKSKVLVPWLTSKLLVVLNNISYSIVDFITRLIGLEGKQEV